ncbi:MAG TPA: hypothetical protein PLO89_01245, partial [Spirochaetota bacterium]|nr:hypothetical protein [Spirochaetota bacterium]
SIMKVLKDAIKKIFKKKEKNQKKVETSLIERFMYPKYGAGQIYSEIAFEAVKKGVKLNLNHKVVNIIFEKDQIVGVRVKNLLTNEVFEERADYIISSMPIKDLMQIMETKHSEDIKKIYEGLVYRDYLTVGLLLRDMKLKNETKFKSINNIIPDNWIYVQERDVKIGRLDIFNNFSLYMLNDFNKIWLGAEYFCTVGDEIWNKTDSEIENFAVSELEKIDLIRKEDVVDKVVFRVEKAYPAYFGTYDKFDILKKYLDKYENLFLVGRNGMHKYNNMDHSMLSAMTAVDNIKNGIKSKDNIWAVNTEEEYHEEKK